MAVDYFFEPATIDLPSLDDLRCGKWSNCPASVRGAVAQEYQYFLFQVELLRRVRVTAAGSLSNRSWDRPLDLTVRAGAVKAAVLVAGSIIEAVLRAIAEKRSYRLASDPRKRTLGNILNAWKTEVGGPREEVASFWPALETIHRVRDNVHLYEASLDPEARFNFVLRHESHLLRQATSALDGLSTIVP